MGQCGLGGTSEYSRFLLQCIHILNSTVRLVSQCHSSGLLHMGAHLQFASIEGPDLVCPRWQLGSEKSRLTLSQKILKYLEL